MILAVDCALGACAVAVAQGAQIVRRIEPMERGHAERLAPLAHEALAEAGAGFRDVERIAVTVGPGSFTGIRVGLAYARGLALALARPCIGVSTLELLAARARGLRSAAVSAGAEDVFFASYSDTQVLHAPQRLSLSEARALCPGGAVIGPAARLFEGHGSPIVPEEFGDPGDLARLAVDRDPALHPPEPLYLRAPDARLPGGARPS